MHQSTGMSWFVRTSVVTLLLASPSHAQTTGSDKAAAEALFDEARDLLDAGRYADACPKLAASQRLDPGVGTLLYLGECYERDGKLASAWATFREAAGAAQNVGQTARAELARSRAATLAPQVPRLAVRVAAPDAEGVEVRRDDVVLGKELLGSAIPLDPGPHTVQARAPGRIAWATTLTLRAGQSETVTVPDLAVDTSGGSMPAPYVAPQAPLAPPAASAGGGDTGASEAGGWTGQHTAAVVLGGVGVVGLGLGTYFGLRTFSLWDDSQSRCGARGCTQEGKDLADSARTSGNLATASFAIGGAALAGGAVLWIVSPSLKRSTARLAPWGTGHALGLSAEGTW